MSYINMDHAGWVERNAAAGKRIATASEVRKAKSESRGWPAAPETLNLFQRRAFDILGIVGGGIYNAPIGWKSVYWQPKLLILPWWNGMSTFDFDALTMFVFLCHEARIRGHISPLNNRYVEIALHERRPDGGISRSHPNLDEAIARFRDAVPADHSTFYRAAAPEDAA